MRTNRSAIDLEENKTVYIKKMNRQMKEAEKKVKELEKIAKDRHAGDNTEVKKDLDNLRQKLDAVTRKFEGLKAETKETWPEGSRDISGAYKELEGVLETVGSEVKRK